MKDKTWLWRFDPGNCWAPYYGTIDAPDRETARVNMLRLIRHHIVDVLGCRWPRDGGTHQLWLADMTKAERVLRNLGVRCP